MEHNSLLQEFLNISDDKKVERSLFCKKIISFLSNYDFEILSTTDAILFWKSDKVLSKTRFYSLKASLLEYIEFLDKKGLVDCESYRKQISKITFSVISKQACSTSIEYYRNINEVLDLIEKVINYKHLRQTDALPIQTIVILLWHGLSFTSILSILRDDIDRIKKMIKVDGKLYSISEREIEILYQYSNLWYYNGLSSNRKVTRLQESPYLLRSSRGQRTTEVSISYTLTALNKAFLECEINRVISADILNKNRIFGNIYAAENDGEMLDRNLIKKYFNTTDNNSITGFLESYKRWKLFFNL